MTNEVEYIHWLDGVIKGQGCLLGEVSYIFLGDSEMLHLNQKYLNHDTLTDIITFDYATGMHLYGDIFISVDRVRENAMELGIPFETELRRVMVHGVLHLIGYADKSDDERKLMRATEEKMMKLFHVEH
ncbi:MAG: rRNA maturation RNase YbeY [Bacteroidota bacterium]